MSSTPTTNVYTIDVITWPYVERLLDYDVHDFIRLTGEEMAQAFGLGPQWKEFDLVKYLRNGGRIALCRHKGRYVGLLAARLAHTIWDNHTLVLHQDLLFALPRTRAAKYLLDEFIDFGKANANHIETCIGRPSNIKESSLVKYGFKKYETTYRIEV